MRTPAPIRSTGHRLPLPPSAAFSLIELAVAFGILVFAVVALLGLLTVGLGAGTRSQVDTLEAMVAQEVAASLRTNDLSRWDALAFPTNYFDYGGKPLPSPSGAYFACVVTPQGPDPLASRWATNAFRAFRITLLSPASSPTPATNVFHSANALPPR